jgi:acyl dehydratase
MLDEFLKPLIGDCMAKKKMPFGPNARFFDDFTEGEEFVTQGRTITQNDGLFWAMFTGDMNPMHVDEDFASRYGLFGGRFPPGLMAVAIVSGLEERLGLTAGTGLAMIEQTIRYKTPVLFGDTIHAKIRIQKKEAHPKKPRGKIYFHYEILKGNEELAIEGEWVMLVSNDRQN